MQGIISYYETVKSYGADFWSEMSQYLALFQRISLMAAKLFPWKLPPPQKSTFPKCYCEGSVATIFFNFLILKGFCWGWGGGWAGEWRVNLKTFSVLKSYDSVMCTVSPVFGEPWGIKTTGGLGFKCKSSSWICVHLENLKSDSQRRSWYLGQLGGFDQSRKHIFSSNKIAMAGSSLPSDRICKADGYESVSFGESEF